MSLDMFRNDLLVNVESCLHHVAWLPVFVSTASPFCNNWLVEPLRSGMVALTVSVKVHLEFFLSIILVSFSVLMSTWGKINETSGSSHLVRIYFLCKKEHFNHSEKRLKPSAENGGSQKQLSKQVFHITSCFLRDQKSFGKG